MKSPNLERSIVILRHPQNFFRRRCTCQHLVGTVLQQRPHAALDGGVAQHAGVGLFHDQAADGVIHGQQFVNAGAPAVAGAAAALAAAAEEPFSLRDGGVMLQTKFAQRFAFRPARHAAFGAQHAHQTLRHHGQHR